MTLAERLRTALERSGLGQSDLARRAGTTQPTINKLLTGKSLTSKKLVPIANVLGVSAEWLVTGKGEIGSNPPDYSSELIDNQDIEEIEIPRFKNINSAFTSDGNIQSNSDKTLKLTDDELTSYGVSASYSDLIAFQLNDDTMSPIMPEGAIVGVDTGDRQIVDGKVYVIDQDGWRRVRRIFRKSADKLILKSFSESLYPDEEASIRDIKILGRVFFCVSVF